MGCVDFTIHRMCFLRLLRFLLLACWENEEPQLISPVGASLDSDDIFTAAYFSTLINILISQHAKEFFQPNLHVLCIVHERIHDMPGLSRCVIKRPRVRMLLACLTN